MPPVQGDADQTRCANNRKLYFADFVPPWCANAIGSESFGAPIVLAPNQIDRQVRCYQHKKMTQKSTYLLGFTMRKRKHMQQKTTAKIKRRAPQS